MATVERQPFGEVSSGRLQQLASAKNRLNGFVSTKEAGKPTTGMPMSSPTKRSYAMSSMNDDSENVDPVHTTAKSKKNKLELYQTPTKPSGFAKSTTVTFTEPSTRRLNLTSPSRTPTTAPAGRSPKRKSIGFAATRRSFAPYTRVESPFSRGPSTGLPFSLDAALNSTLGPATPAQASAKPVPCKWKFEIYEDTPDEEAGILMEHSTLTLDLSSDDESSLDKKADRGKENVAPEGYDALASPTSSQRESTVVTPPKLEIVRKKIETDEMDDGQRTPLSELEIEPFSSIEADEPAFVVIDDAEQSAVCKDASKTQFTFTATASTASKSTGRVSKHDSVPCAESEIVVFEDEPIELPPTTT